MQSPPIVISPYPEEKYESRKEYETSTPITINDLRREDNAIKIVPTYDPVTHEEDDKNIIEPTNTDILSEILGTLAEIKEILNERLRNESDAFSRPRVHHRKNSL